MLYHECPACGAHLDHGERCDCQDLPGLTRTGYYTDSAGTFGTLALCKMGGFINTLEGWSLLVSGDKEAYRAAKAAYDKEEAAPDAATSKSGENTPEGAQKHLEFTTSGTVPSNGGNYDG